VRGLDYYTKTVFEIFEETAEDRKPGALVGGGRLDGLVKLLRGKDTPACGGALGVERVIERIKQKTSRERTYVFPAAKIFLAQLGNLAKRKSLKLFEDFRQAKVPISESLSKDSIKTQLRTADKLGVAYTLIIGQKEALDGTIIIKDMVSGQQDIIKLDKAVREMKKRLKNRN